MLIIKDSLWFFKFKNLRHYKKTNLLGCPGMQYTSFNFLSKKLIIIKLIFNKENIK